MIATDSLIILSNHSSTHLISGNKTLATDSLIILSNHSSTHLISGNKTLATDALIISVHQFLKII
jgi:hypothetical protein